MKLANPEADIRSWRLPLHWSHTGQENRRLKLNVSFGSSDNDGERPVLTLTVDSFGHV